LVISSTAQPSFDLKEWLHLEFRALGIEACQRLHDSCGGTTVSTHCSSKCSFISFLRKAGAQPRDFGSSLDFIMLLNVNTMLACGDDYRQIAFWAPYAHVSAMGGCSIYLALANDLLGL